MYQVGAEVLYGAQGVCRIAGIEPKKMGGEEHEYYVLKPVFDEKATVFVPVQNKRLTAKMRQVLTKAEVHLLIDGMGEKDSIWIADDSKRKQQYQEILMEGDPARLAQLVKTLFQHREEQREKGRKLHLIDERFYKEAEKLLHEELALVLDIPRDRVASFIEQRAEQK